MMLHLSLLKYAKQVMKTLISAAKGKGDDSPVEKIVDNLCG
jgi:hypothetical protein